jgi:hypothetical protein
MITDQFLTASSPNITTAGGANYDTVDCWDTQNPRDLYEGHTLRLIVTIPAGQFGGGSGSSVAISLWAAETTAYSSNAYTGSPTFISGFRTFTQAQLAAGGSFEMPIGPVNAASGTTMKRFMFVRCEATGTNAFTGSGNIITARIVIDSQDGRTFYASGYTV